MRLLNRVRRPSLFIAPVHHILTVYKSLNDLAPEYNTNMFTGEEYMNYFIYFTSLICLVIKPLSIIVHILLLSLVLVPQDMAYTLHLTIQVNYGTPFAIPSDHCQQLQLSNGLFVI